VEALTFRRCRAAHPVGQYFTVDECSAGQVINIRSAELGYSQSYNPHTRPPTCPMRNCTSPTDVPARQCNGRRSCRISQTILLFPNGTALCSQQRDGNFIRIIFTCVTGMNDFAVTSVFYKCKQEGQHPLTGQRAPPISGGT